MKRSFTGILLMLLMSSAGTFAQSGKAAVKDTFVMKTYYLVFLKKGPSRSQDSLTRARIQEQHLAHLDRMAAEGKLCIAGPLMSDGDIRGICVYNVPTKEEAEKLASDDPAVKAGRLVVEVHPFYSAQGARLP